MYVGYGTTASHQMYYSYHIVMWQQWIPSYWCCLRVWLLTGWPRLPQFSSTQSTLIHACTMASQSSKASAALSGSMEAMVLGEFVHTYIHTYVHTYVSGSCGGDKFSMHWCFEEECYRESEDERRSRGIFSVSDCFNENKALSILWAVVLSFLL